MIHNNFFICEDKGFDVKGIFIELVGPKSKP